MRLVQRIEDHLVRRARRRARPMVVRIYDHLKRRFPDRRIQWDDFHFRVVPPNEMVALQIFNYMFMQDFTERYGVNLRLDQNAHVWIS